MLLQCKTSVSDTLNKLPAEECNKCFPAHRAKPDSQHIQGKGSSTTVHTADR